MKCAWQAYINLLPHRLRHEVDNLGRDDLQELRLRIGQPPELVLAKGNHIVNMLVTREDLEFCVNASSQYSPWSSTTIVDGFITAPGGHRIGICGDSAIVNGKHTTFTRISSLCLRVARDFPGIGLHAAGIHGSTLIIGSPGRGKTTLLRDIARQKSNLENCAIAVVDERREIFPTVGGLFCFSPGIRTDVVSGLPKRFAMEMLIRTMNPQWLFLDEITASEDCDALIQACFCGVSVVATAHGADLQDFLNRPVYKTLINNRCFQNVIVMQSDKTWVLERMNT